MNVLRWKRFENSNQHKRRIVEAVEADVTVPRVLLGCLPVLFDDL